MRGLKNEAAIVADESSTASQKFKKRLRWSKTKKWFDDGGIGILAYAVVSNEVHVVEELLKVLKRDFNGEEYTRRLESRLRDDGYTSLGIPGGTTTLMGAMMTASPEVVSMLLESGANVESVDVMGNDGLALASAFGRSENIKCWFATVNDYDLEKQNTVLGATALILSTNMGANKIESVKTLCESGARVDALTYAGFSVLMAACANEDSDPKVVKLLLKLYDRVHDLSLDGDVNFQVRSRTLKWKLLRGTAKVLVRSHVVNSVLAKHLAHGAGLTALHYAARRGDVEIVTLLLEAGADPYIENEMGLNSFEISDKYGPFPSVTRTLRNYNNKDK
jgi:hypothetical protein